VKKWPGWWDNNTNQMTASPSRTGSHLITQWGNCQFALRKLDKSGGNT
jgi:hypothetical protein